MTRVAAENSCIPCLRPQIPCSKTTVIGAVVMSALLIIGLVGAIYALNQTAVGIPHGLVAGCLAVITVGLVIDVIFIILMIRTHRQEIHRQNEQRIARNTPIESPDRGILKPEDQYSESDIIKILPKAEYEEAKRRAASLRPGYHRTLGVTLTKPQTRGIDILVIRTDQNPAKLYFFREHKAQVFLDKYHKESVHLDQANLVTGLTYQTCVRAKLKDNEYWTYEPEEAHISSGKRWALRDFFEGKTFPKVFAIAYKKSGSEVQKEHFLTAKDRDDFIATLGAERIDRKAKEAQRVVYDAADMDYLADAQDYKKFNEATLKTNHYYVCDIKPSSSCAEPIYGLRIALENFTYQENEQAVPIEKGELRIFYKTREERGKKIDTLPNTFVGHVLKA